MKILVKLCERNYLRLLDQTYPNNHVAPIWNFDIRKTFRELGHETNFIYSKPHVEIVHDSGYDVLFFHQLTSFKGDPDYSMELLNNFKGIKIFYTPCFTTENLDLISKFDYIFTAGGRFNKLRWHELLPSSNIISTEWHSPRFEHIDQDVTNPFNSNEFKIVYFGIVIEKYLTFMKRLAEDGEHVWFGGMYIDSNTKLIRDFTEEEIRSFPKNLHIIRKGQFIFGDQFKYLHHANLALVFQESNCTNAVRHKLVESLVCGTRALVEESTSNGSAVYELESGGIFPFGNYDILKAMIQLEKPKYHDRNVLKNRARKIFSMSNILNDVLKVAK